MAGKNVTIGNVNIAMSVNAANMIAQATKAQKGFNANIKSMQKTALAFATKTSKAFKGLKDVTGSTLGAIGKLGAIGGISGGGLTALAYQIYESQREMQRMSDTAGVSLGQFTQMSHITSSLGLETEYLADAMKDLNVRIVDASKGGGTLTDFFTLMGEDAQKWVKLNPVQQLEKFQSVISKLPKSEAQFWADEVNDSMYRLSTTLDRSGRSLSEFTAEAEGLGAGTSASYIENVNKMYESFSRLKIIVTEIAQTSFNLLAKAIGTTADALTDKLKTAINEGGNISKSIFELSKGYALTTLKAFETAYIGVNSFVTKIRLLLGKLDSSFSEGLLPEDDLERLSSIEDQIDDLKSAAKGGFFRDKVEASELEKIKVKLTELRKERDALFAGADDSVVLKGIRKLSEDLEKVAYKAPDALSKMSSSRGGVGSGSITKDPAELKSYIALAKELNAEYALMEDSGLKQIAADKQKMNLMLSYYKAQQASKGVTAANTQYIKDAQNALAVLDQQQKMRNAELAKEKREELEQLQEEELSLEREKQQRRFAYLQEYTDKAKAIRAYAVLEERRELTDLLRDGIISRQEYTDAITRQTENRTAEELRLEMSKIGGTLTGLSYFMNESQTMARAGFAFTQAVALQEVLMNQYKAVSAAWADPTLPWYAKAGAAVTAAAAVGSQLSGIQAMGQFHNGGEIPYDGTYYMEGGEIVVPKDKVGDYINAIDKNGGGGGGTVINSSINIGASLVDEKAMAQALSKQQSVIAALVQKEQKKRPTRNR